MADVSTPEGRAADLLANRMSTDLTIARREAYLFADRHIVDVLDAATSGFPKAWAELIEALMLLAQHQANEDDPTRCDHDKLTVAADPDAFTPRELARLEELGFLPGKDGTFYSFRYGNA